MNITTLLLAAAIIGTAGTSTVAASSITSEDASVVARNQPDEPIRSFEGSRPVPETTGQNQPQGPTGPINTATEGGAPAESPQGETPPGMQSAPEGSSKTTVEPKQ